MPNTLENIRNYAASLQGEERKSFIEKFNSIKDDDAKVETLGTRISSLSAPKHQFNTIAEAQAAMQEAQQEQQQAERNANWINVIGNANRGLDLGQAVNNYALPAVAGMGVGGTVVRGLAGAGAGLARQIGAGMAGGAAGGAVTGGMAPADNMQQRVGQAGLTAAVGGVLGGVAPIVGEGIKAGVDTFRKAKNLIKLNKSLPNANKLQSAIDELNLNRSNIQNAQELSNIQTKSGIQKVNEVISQDKNMFGKTLNSVTQAFNKSKDDFKKIINEKSGELSRNIKQPIMTFFRNSSKAYGEARDSIFAAIDDPVQAQSILKKNATPVTRTEFLDEANSVLKEFADQPDIVNSKSYQGLINLTKKYAVEGADTGIVDASGKAIKQSLPESLDFKQLIGDLKDYNKTFSTGFESGSKALSPDELVASRFNYSMGNIIKERVPKFAELQKSYKPVIDNKKLAYTIFKPGNEVSSSSAQALFKRVASGKSSQQDKDLLAFIQKGTKVGDKEVAGIGDFTKELNDIATKIAKEGKQFDLSKRALTAKNELDIQTLKEVSKNLLSKNKTNQLSTLGKVEQLDNRLSKLTDLLRQRKSIDEVKKGLAIKGISAAIGGGAGYVVSRINK